MGTPTSVEWAALAVSRNAGPGKLPDRRALRLPRKFRGNRRAKSRSRQRDWRDGTLPPARRAWDNPIAIACLRLRTFLPERPERSVPRFI